jgi:tetratricopeptide (TPR) repeat protein
MDKGPALKEIQARIAAGKRDEAVIMISEVVSNFPDDPLALLTCASLLRALGENAKTKIVVSRISECSSSNFLGIAKGLRGIGYPSEALSVLEKEDATDDRYRLEAGLLRDLKKFDRSLEISEKISLRTIEDDIGDTEALIASKRVADAVARSEELITEAPGIFEVQKCYCSALISAGRQKEAEKYVRSKLKEDKSADANALSAYLFWVLGRTSGAGACASKAVQADPGHIGAMEILAYCMIDKGKINEAKIIAGAINEKSPGHSAVLRILDMCRS